jgi:mono/diheme cytochrome c family protein
VDIPHEKLDWFHQKIKDPRIYDRGRELQPLEKLRMPNYDATDEEAHLLVTAIMSYQRDIQPAAALRPHSARVDSLLTGRALVRRRNCVGCHEIEGDGGDFRQLVSDPTLAPPLLTPEGAKVQPDWLYAFLKNPITIRPWLAVRMPTFHVDDATWNQVIRYFGAISDTIGPFRTHEVVRTANLQPSGAEMFQLLRCQQCHVLGAIPADQPTANLAPDLRMAPERLQPDWIADWLRDPQRIQPGTRMPAFWPNYPKSDFPQLNGDAQLQIQAIRDHLLTFRGGPAPPPPGAVATQQTASPE